MRWSRRLWLVALCGGLLLPPATYGDDTGARSGMEAHVDPETGRLLPEPVTPRPERPLTTPPPPLAEVPGPRGGMVVDLQGRFTSDVVATVNPDGSVRIDCVTGGGARADDAQQQ